MTNRTCVFEECTETKIIARGLCGKHYQQVRAMGKLEEYAKPPRPRKPLRERFEAIGWNATETGCWEWKGSVNAYGYGQINGGGRSRPLVCSRVSWELYVGKIPEGQCVCHKCDNRLCVNPSHLFLGEKRDNNADMAEKRRTLNGERRPQSKLTDSDVLLIRELYARGGITQLQLAKKFGVGQSAISLIVSQKRRGAMTYPVAPSITGLESQQ